ncbi:MAG: DUF4157 domain-containing protein [Coleofasciculus sp. A1-SPW-01]|uniref:eCIS core domain-containing protein n=1 Tax=Coleofasciculus sp. A1-SPW-01 TaxID=3070819 RepID=UPI003301A789
MYKPLQKKNSSWTPTTAQKKSKSPSKLGHFSIQPKPNQKSSQSQEIGEYSRDSADRLAANVMRSLEAKGSQETETPTVQPQSESRISVADVVGQRMSTLTPRTLTPLQRKLTVGQPGDKYEQEADTVAAKVVEQINSPTSQQSVQGKVEPVAQPTVMRDGGVGGGAVDDSVEQSIQQAKGSGQGLSEKVREPMEQAFGADFSGVRVHNNSNADQLNRSLNARAFTTGPDIFFKQGEYNPGSRDGQELLAHELTHVVQQSGSQLKTKQAGSEKRTSEILPDGEVTFDKGQLKYKNPTLQAKAKQIIQRDDEPEEGTRSNPIEYSEMKVLQWDWKMIEEDLFYDDSAARFHVSAKFGKVPLKGNDSAWVLDEVNASRQTVRGLTAEANSLTSRYYMLNGQLAFTLRLNFRFKTDDVKETSSTTVGGSLSAGQKATLGASLPVKGVDVSAGAESSRGAGLNLSHTWGREQTISGAAFDVTREFMFTNIKNSSRVQFQEVDSFTPDPDMIGAIAGTDGWFDSTSYKFVATDLLFLAQVASKLI